MRLTLRYQHAFLFIASILVSLTPVLGESYFTRGDVNQDGTVDLSDALSLLAYLYQTGETPGCMDSADCNDDGAVDLADGVSLLCSVFNSEDLPDPSDGNGMDFTFDHLTCDVFMPYLLDSVDVIANYRFNGNALDYSAHGNDGIVNGAALVNDRHGNRDSAYQFDGVDGMEIETAPINLMASMII